MEEDKNIGTVMTWNDIVDHYPDKIVGLLDYDEKNDPITAKLMCVCNDKKERFAKIKEFAKKNLTLYWTHTIEPMGGNGLWQL